MAKAGGPLRNMFIWSHERGSIPYDIICALILLFIFLVPRGCFIAQDAGASQSPATETSDTVPEDGTEKD